MQKDGGQNQASSRTNADQIGPEPLVKQVISSSAATGWPTIDYSHE